MKQHFFIVYAEMDAEGNPSYTLDNDSLELLPGTIYDTETRQWSRAETVEEDTRDHLLATGLQILLDADLTGG